MRSAMTSGRPMKVGKEEMIGLLTAVELYLREDHAARIAARGRTHTIAELDGSPHGTAATLLGTVVVHGFVGHTLRVAFSDGTAELWLDIDTRVTVLSPDSDGGLNEIDISLGTDLEAASGVEVLAVRPLPRP